MKIIVEKKKKKNRDYKNNIAIRIVGKVSRYIDASMNRATPSTYCCRDTDSQAAGSRGSRTLHAILYTLLIQGRLKSAVEFVESLLRDGDLGAAATSVCGSEARSSRDKPPLSVKSSSA